MQQWKCFCSLAVKVESEINVGITVMTLEVNEDTRKDVVDREAFFLNLLTNNSTVRWNKILSFLPLQFCQHAANNHYSFILYIIPIYQTSKHNFVLQCCFIGAKWVQWCASTLMKHRLFAPVTSLFGVTVLQSTTTSSNQPCCHCLSWVDPKLPYLRVKVWPWHQESQDEFHTNILWPDCGPKS